MRASSVLGAVLCHELAATTAPRVEDMRLVIQPRGVDEAYERGWPSLLHPSGTTVFDRRDGQIYDADGRVVGERRDDGSVKWLGKGWRKR